MEVLTESHNNTLQQMAYDNINCMIHGDTATKSSANVITSCILIVNTNILIV